MKKNRLIFFSVFGAFHLLLVLFTFYVESQKNDFAFLTQILRYMSWLKYGALLGLLLLIADVIWTRLTARAHDREMAALAQEVNALKAKLFDLQEAAHKSTPPPAADHEIKP